MDMNVRNGLICLIIVAILTACVPNVAIASMGNYSISHYNKALNPGDHIPTVRGSTSNGILNWKYATKGIVTSSATPNGILYVGSNDHNVYALNAANGTKVWNYATGSLVWSKPAIANGIVYIGSMDNNVYALNATTGTKIWSYATGEGVFSSPTVSNGVVYVGSDDHNVYALNANTGTKVWGYETGGNVSSCPTVANGSDIKNCL